MDWASIALNAMTRGFTLDDDSIEKLTAAAQEITVAVQADPSRLIPYTLTGFDPTAPMTGDAVNDAESFILKHWKSFRHSYQDRPQMLLRYVLVAGVLQTAENPELAAVMYNTLRDVLPRLIDQSETHLHTLVLNHLKPVCAAFAHGQWTSVKAFEIPEVRVPPRYQVSPPEQAQGEISEQVIKALKVLSYTDSAGAVQNLNIKNAAAVGTGIAEAVVSTLKQAAEEINTKMPRYFRSAEEYHKAIQGILSSATTRQREQNLLWWLTAKFSPSQQRSYRTMQPFDGAVQMALDFQAITSAAVPDEVEAVLIEAIYATYPAAAHEPRPLQEVLQGLSMQADHPEWVARQKADGRMSLVEVVRTMAGRSDTDLPALAGIHADTSVLPSELAVWLLHSLQAEKLAL